MGGIAINLQGVLAVAGVLCGALLGCDKPAPRHEIRVMAAASLRDAFEAIEHAFEPEHPNTDVVISFAGSQVLATQLLEGAAADVFASADEVQMGRVAALCEAPACFASNHIVVITPADSSIGSIEALTAPGVLVVLGADGVPAGRIARTAFDALELWDSIEPNIASNEPDVRGVLMKILLGEGDAGVVYATDAMRASPGRLRAIEFPEGVDCSSEYPIAVLRNASSSERANAFVRFVLGEPGQAILRQHGFEAP
ncbi:MAG: molybdate ABC transporter substrate-binding protein [Phycisphaerales bacterium]|nr:molybdate ABC transporter substrate-binding protein [Phycisphaerales bacterium]